MVKILMKFHFTIFFVSTKIVAIPVKSIDVSRIVYYSHLTAWGVSSISPRGVSTTNTCVARVTQRGWGIGHTKVSLKVKYTTWWNVEGHHGNIAESCRVFELVVASLLPSPVKHINERMNGKENWVIRPPSGSHVSTYIAVEVAHIALQTHAHFCVVVTGQGQSQFYHGREFNGRVEIPHDTGLPAARGSETMIRHTVAKTRTVTTKVVRLPDNGFRKIPHICGKIKVRHRDTTVNLL